MSRPSRRRCLRRTASILATFLLASCGRSDDASAPGPVATTPGETAPPSDSPPAVPSTGKAPKLSPAPGIIDRSENAPLKPIMTLADPMKDAQWTSEAFNTIAGNQLHHLTDLLDNAENLAAMKAHLKEFVSPAYAGTTFAPETEIVFEDGPITVRRPPAGSDLASSFVGEDGFAAAVTQLASVFGTASGATIKVKFKIVRVNIDGQKAETIAYYEASSVQSGKSIQHRANWTLGWVRASGSENPLLASVRIADFEEVIRTGDKPSFADCTESLLGTNESYRKQLVHGSDHWYGNLDVAFGIHQGNQGLSIGDADGDGLDDLFLCQPTGLSSLLYLRQKDGTLKDATREAGLDYLDAARSALFADLDNDGDQDLAVSLNYSLALFENDGKGHFDLRSTIEMFSWPSSIAAADFDNDGDLDIFVCGYNPRGETAPGDIFANPVPYHDANNGARNFMLRNEGEELRFADVTASVGLNENNRRFSFAATWEDFDNDGDQDLYVANDFGRNNLYRNDLQADGSRRFTDIAASAGVEDVAAGMSVSWADYNHDGLMDLYVSNMFSSAGNRVAYQRQFKPGTDETSLRDIQHHARGNSLFQNAGDGTFRDVSVESGVTMGRWAWGSHFTDLNNDGWEDIYVANGFFTTEDSGDL
jgi:hypothetical protein